MRALVVEDEVKMAALLAHRQPSPRSPSSVTDEDLPAAAEEAASLRETIGDLKPMS